MPINSASSLKKANQDLKAQINVLFGEIKNLKLQLLSWTKVLGEIYICAAFSHAPNKFMYTCSAAQCPPPPPHLTMLDTCTRYFSRVSTLYWGGGGGDKREATHFKTDNSVLRFKTTEN